MINYYSISTYFVRFELHYARVPVGTVQPSWCNPALAGHPQSGYDIPPNTGLAGSELVNPSLSHPGGIF